MVAQLGYATVAERFFNQPLHSHIANTTIMVIAIPHTVWVILS
jgi:hypothetical protein